MPVRDLSPPPVSDREPPIPQQSEVWRKRPNFILVVEFCASGAMDSPTREVVV